MSREKADGYTWAEHRAYWAGVKAVCDLLDGWDDSGQLDRDIQEAIEEGII